MIDKDRLKASLPVFPGIMNKDKFFNSAVLIPIIKIGDEYFILFEKRSANIRQGGEICFPGGAIEKELKESIIDAALREAEEEIGLDRNKVEIIGRLDTLCNPVGIIIEPVIGICSINSLDELVIDKTEVEKIFLVSIKYFLETEPEKHFIRLEVSSSYVDNEGSRIELLPVEELGLPISYKQTWAKRKRPVFVYKTEGEVIWGMTAEIIYEFISRVRLGNGYLS